MLLYCEPARRMGREGHLSDSTRRDMRLDVIAMQMNDDRPVAAPAQAHIVALPHADLAHFMRDLALLDSDIERDISSQHAHGRQQTDRYQANGRSKKEGHGVPHSD